MKLICHGDRASGRTRRRSKHHDVPRSLASAAGPLLAGHLLSISGFGWPLVIAGGLKIIYDVLLLRMFRTIRPPEEGHANC